MLTLRNENKHVLLALILLACGAVGIRAGYDFMAGFGLAAGVVLVAITSWRHWADQ